MPTQSPDESIRRGGMAATSQRFFCPTARKALPEAIDTLQKVDIPLPSWNRYSQYFKLEFSA